MHPTKSSAVIRTTFCVAPIVMTAFGCNVDPLYPKANRPKGPAMSITEAAGRGHAPDADISVVNQSEVDLVEAVSAHRSAYVQTLEALRDYYRDHGYITKQSWADFELAGLHKVQTFRYVMDAEIPSDELRPRDSIPEADALYKRGTDLMKKGGHGIPVFYRESPMVQAVGAFHELIEKYPTSDKIDDAAFQLGQVHKEYLHDQEPIAVKWYERAWAWDPNTPHEPRFQAAVIYDYRLHDRDRALELYQLVLKDETPEQCSVNKLARRTNVDFATRRIGELTRETRSARVGG